MPGLKDANLSFTVFTTYGTAADAIDSLIGDAYRSGDPVAVSVQPDAAGTTGQFSMLTKVYSFSPISGAVGEANVSEVSLRNAGTAGLVVGGTANL